MEQVGTESIPAPPKVALLVNAKSRRGRDWFEAANRGLKAYDLELVTAEAFTRVDRLLRAAQAQVHRKVDILAVGGGDGTLSAVARLMAGSDTALGVIPLGTGNAFARDLGIRTSIEHACEVIALGRPAAVDMGFADDRPFLNVATVGLSTLIAMGLHPQWKHAVGPLAYVMPALHALRVVRPFRAHVVGPNVDETFESLQVVIGNGRFHAGRLPIAPGAGLTTGELVVYGLASGRRSAFVKMALSLWRGRHVDLDEVRVFRMDHGRLETSPLRAATLDGERALMTPFEFHVRRGALKVRVPEEFE